MPLRESPDSRGFGITNLEAMTTAFDEAMRSLGTDSDTQTRETLARQIIELAMAGERDPAKLCAGRIALGARLRAITQGPPITVRSSSSRNARSWRIVE
jgi:hypothetical protein